MIEGQTTIFDMLYQKYRITKPIRLIELFGGYGSQALALKYLGVEFQHWKLVEWAVKSIKAYKDIHMLNDNNDYSKNLTKEELIDYLSKKGISANYNEPMLEIAIARLKEETLRNIYNDIQATHNLVNIQQVKGEDLEIIDTDKYDYILTYSFPCQDLSLAGKGMGMSDTSTRSGLLWEVERILTECENKPQILLMENVPQVKTNDSMAWERWLARLEELGYRNYHQDLIATDYGIPQTRNRTFMISLLGDYNYTFPKPIPLKLKLKDMLEDNVDEKYYLSDAMINYVCSRMPTGENKITTGINMGNKESIDNAGTLTTGEGSKPSSNYIIDNEEYDYSKSEGRIIQKHLKETLEQREKPIKDGSYIDSYNRKIRDDDLSSTISTKTNSSNDTYIALVKNTENYIEWEDGKNIQMNCRAWKDDKVIATLNTGGETKILIKNATLKGYLEATEGDGIDISSRMEYHRGTVQKGKTQTLTTMGGENNGMVLNDLRIRKLTPRECFRLMGVKDEDFDKVAKNQSDSSLYHLAGDSIVVNVLMAIFKELV